MIHQLSEGQIVSLVREQQSNPVLCLSCPHYCLTCLVCNASCLLSQCLSCLLWMFLPLRDLSLSPRPRHRHTPTRHQSSIVSRSHGPAPLFPNHYPPTSIPIAPLLPSLWSRFASPNPFSSLQSESSDSNGEDDDEPLPFPPFPLDSLGLPLTTPLLVHLH
jgi:hypothetical protein